MAKIASALGMRVIAYRGHGEGVEMLPLKEVLAQADVLSLHCPLTGETRGMINREALAKMKDGAILINTGRGAVLEEAAVVEALDSGKLYAVGADVFSDDPCGRDNPLANHPRCIATPHVAWTPVETRDRVIAIGGENLAAFLANHPQNVVNAPKPVQ